MGGRRCRHDPLHRRAELVRSERADDERAHDDLGQWRHLFAGGPGGRLRYADGAWSPDGTSPTSAIAGSSASDVWACGSSGVAHWDGQSWQALAQPTTCTNLWVAGAGDVWLTSARHLMHGGVGGFVQNDPPYLTHAFAQNGATAVWARSPGDVWVTGSAEVYHWDGTSWSLPEVLVEAPDALLGVTGDAQSTWLLGSRGIILHK